MATFFYDFNSPYAYLAASRVDALLGPDVRWQPIAFAFLLRHQGRTPWSLVEETRVAGMEECQARARAYGLAPIRWPPEWPVGSYGLLSLRAALAAGEQGHLVEFSRAAFRRHFVDGLALTGAEDIAALAADLGLDAAPLLARAASPEVKAALTAVTQDAIGAGVHGVPSVEVAGRLFWGDDALEAASELR